MKVTMFGLSASLGFVLLLGVIVGPLGAEDHPKLDSADGWKPLLVDRSLSGWKTRGKWKLDDEGVLTRGGGGDIWTVEEYGDFILDLEFKVKPDSNSGVGLRVASPAPAKGRRWYTDGALEVQILGPEGHKESERCDCGSMYDLVAPAKDMQKKAGEWNRYTITAKGSRIKVVFNGEKIIDMDLDNWPEARKNPDGTPNKYRKAMKGFPRAGHILLQEHGQPIWFRNIYVKKLDGTSDNHAADTRKKASALIISGITPRIVIQDKEEERIGSGTDQP